MSKLRVHELARELGRQNREVIEFLKSKGVDVRSHMSMVDEPAVSEVKNRFRKDNNNRGKEHIAKLETPKTEEKVVTAKSEGDKTETPKKKKNIIRVFHAQNASDGGKTRKKPVKAEGERTGSPRNAEGRNSDSSRTDGDRPRRNNNDRPGTGNRRPDGQNRQGRPQGEGRSQGDNRQGGRFGQGRSQGDGQGRPGGRFQGDGNRQPSYQFIKALLNHEKGLHIDNDHFMIISPDEGSMNRAIYLANILGVDMGMYYKRLDYSKRINGRHPIAAYEFLGPNLKGKDMILIDDMISSGDTVLKISSLLKERGAGRIYICSTFGLFTNGLEKFDEAHKAGVFDKLLTTNLIYQSPELLAKDYYISCDMSKYIALIIDTLNHDQSVSYLLNPVDRINRCVSNYMAQYDEK